MSKQTKLIETFTPDMAKKRERDGQNARGVCQVAYYAALRDNKAYHVGPTYNGYKIGNFPPTHPQFTVNPNGEVWLTKTEVRT